MSLGVLLLSITAHLKVQPASSSLQVHLWWSLESLDVCVEPLTCFKCLCSQIGARVLFLLLLFPLSRQLRTIDGN